MGWGFYPSSFTIAFSILKSEFNTSVINVSDCKTFQIHRLRSSMFFFFTNLTVDLILKWDRCGHNYNCVSGVNTGGLAAALMAEKRARSFSPISTLYFSVHPTCMSWS